MMMLKGFSLLIGFSLRRRDLRIWDDKDCRSRFAVGGSLVLRTRSGRGCWMKIENTTHRWIPCMSLFILKQSEADVR